MPLFNLAELYIVAENIQPSIFGSTISRNISENHSWMVCKSSLVFYSDFFLVDFLTDYRSCCLPLAPRNTTSALAMDVFPSIAPFWPRWRYNNMDSASQFEPNSASVQHTWTTTKNILDGCLISFSCAAISSFFTRQQYALQSLQKRPSWARLHRCRSPHVAWSTVIHNPVPPKRLQEVWHSAEYPSNLLRIFHCFFSRSVLFCFCFAFYSGSWRKNPSQSRHKGSLTLRMAMRLRQALTRL
jgi:hypothetical protein